MRSVIGAILFVGGCVLIGAGLISAAITHGSGNFAQGGYAMGGLVVIISFFIMISGIGQKIKISQSPSRDDKQD